MNQPFKRMKKIVLDTQYFFSSLRTAISVKAVTFYRKNV